MSVDWSEEGRIWQTNWKALQSRIRDRFRIAIDKHRHRIWLADRRHRNHGYYPSSLFKSWILRVRGVKSPSSSPLFIIRHRVPLDADVSRIDESVIMRMLRAVSVPILGNTCHIFMHGLNDIHIYGAEKLHQALLERPKGKPLITVSNHVAAVDDPFVIASLLPPNVMLDAQNLRWTLCATDRCFSNPLASAFFRCVKVLPVSRGDGVFQKGMDMALSKLNEGGWVHIFPEGTRSRDGGRTVGAAKRGTGRLILDSDNLPIVIPFVHSGMHEVMPRGSWFPRVGKQVTVVVGDPIRFDDLLLSSDDSLELDKSSLYDAAAARVGHHLSELKTQVDMLVLEQSLRVQYRQTRNSDYGSQIFRWVDWESFGMEEEYVQISEEESQLVEDEEVTQRILNHVMSNTASDYDSLDPSSEGNLVSRFRGFMDPTELMGFAAKGLQKKTQQIRRCVNFGEVGPVKVWKLYLEENLYRTWCFA